MSQKQKLMLDEFSQVKEQLEKKYRKVEQMKVTIKTNEWRKTAADLIASDI